MSLRSLAPGIRGATLVDFLHARYLGLQLNLSDLLHMNIKNLARRIPESILFPLTAYIQTRRVNRAVHMLTEVGKPDLGIVQDQNRFGVNVLGFISRSFGLGEAVRSTIRGLNAARIPVNTVDIRIDGQRKATTWTGRLNVSECHPVSLYHFNPDVINNLGLEIVSSIYRSSTYNIAFWFWETQVLPKHWLKASELFDEIWVASSFCKSVMEKHLGKPVFRIPLNVDTNPTLRSERGSMIKALRDKYVFLTMLDFNSRAERKNPGGVLDAFEKAFKTGQNDVCLIIKIMNSVAGRSELRSLLKKASEDPRIILIDGVISRTDLINLMRESDCLVSLHRAEGFGLPIAEAMSLGIPVIATGWSSNMDFMDSQNSFPVPYRLKRLSKNARPYPKGTLWAEPDTDYAARIMRTLAKYPEIGRIRSRRGQKTILGKFNARSTGKAISERLTAIYSDLSRINVRVKGVQSP